MIFDTLAFAKKLKVAGFSDLQAETLAEAQAELLDEQIVSRQYFDLRIKELELKIESRASDIIKWVAAMLVAQAAVIAALVKLL